MSVDRLLALAATGVGAAALTALARRDPGGRGATAARITLATFLLGGVLAYVAVEWRTGRLSVWNFLPLHLCDFAIFVAAWALAVRSRAAAELIWFWGMAGSSLAMITPDVAGGFPDWRWLAYYALHGGVVASAVLLVFGLGLAPRRGAPWRVFGWTLAYAAGVAAVDAATGANFLYLRAKPPGPTLLDAFGPWPFYIAVAALVALALFLLLDLPFRGRRTA